MSYGRHQSFYLKKHWITKGLNAVNMFGLNTIFDKEKFVLLGLGKNMHQSLRYWMESSNILELSNKAHTLTSFGKILSSYDIGCNNIISVNLIHYFLINENENGIEKSHSFYWFFNNYKETLFTKEKLLHDLILWNANVTSSNTLSRDVDCLIGLHTKDSLDHPEDRNISLLSKMRLITKEGDNYIKSSVKRSELSLNSLFFILLLMKESNIPLSLSNIVSYEGSIGKAFNLSRTELIDLLENMISLEFPIEITRTNNLDTVKIQYSKKPYEFLELVYKGLKI